MTDSSALPVPGSSAADALRGALDVAHLLALRADDPSRALLQRARDLLPI